MTYLYRLEFNWWSDFCEPRGPPLLESEESARLAFSPIVMPSREVSDPQIDFRGLYEIILECSSEVVVKPS